jgi:hypothetical protein
MSPGGPSSTVTVYFKVSPSEATNAEAICSATDTELVCHVSVPDATTAESLFETAVTKCSSAPTARASSAASRAAT